MKVLPFLALFLSLPVAAQTVIRVPGDQPTIQAGIDVAAHGDTVLVAPGTYVEQLDLLGKAIVVLSESGPGVTVIDSQGLHQWPDWPQYPVVRMKTGEGPATIFQGFTVTGSADTAQYMGAAGIYCRDLSPIIVNCRITNIVGGPGLWGDATVEGCEITDNDAPNGDGGGVRGTRPVLRDSTISRNQSGFFGGGVYASGRARLEGCLVQDNVAGDWFDGYSGGGVYGPTILVRCVITGNTGFHWRNGTGYLDEIGSGVEGAVSIDRCTIAFNKIPNSGGYLNEPGGGIMGVGSVTNSIVWANDVAQFSETTAPIVSYSTVMGGYPGTGNLATDPLFQDALAGDFFLQMGSPAIDAATPGTAFDPDGTRADMGGLYFPQFQAQLTLRNGTGVNPICYVSALDPELGSTWVATVDATAHGFNGTLTFVLLYSNPSPPLGFPVGELLVDPTSSLLLMVPGIPASGIAVYQLPLPPDYSLGGTVAYSQAVVMGGGIGLSNALDLLLGL